MSSSRKRQISRRSQVNAKKFKEWSLKVHGAAGADDGELLNFTENAEKKSRR